MSDDSMSWALLKIEELESHCEHLEKDRNNLELEIELIRKELTDRIHMCDMRSEKILELISERDEANRELNIAKNDILDVMDTYQKCAMTRDRFKEERDEARREVCLWQGLDTGKTSWQVADIRGWDCYNKQINALNNLAKLDEELGLND